MVKSIILTDIQLKKFLDSINPPLSKEDYELQISSFQELKKEKYIFRWDMIPRKHNKRLIHFLKKRFAIDWVISAKIEKTDDDATIRVYTETNYLLLKPNSDKTIVSVEIDDGRIEELVVKTKNGKLRLFGKIFVLPYIFNVDHLASICGVPPLQLRLFLSNKRKAYSTFKLPKKRGGFRLISAPSKNMQLVQRWILDNILYKLNAGEYAHGFIPKKSIVTNASVHVGQELILGIDIKDFFPSITLSRVIGLFRSIGYSEKISLSLAELCTFNWRLPQGAPSSPMISNLIAWNMDIKLSKFCNERNLKYSRYADDITISGGKDLPRYKTLIFRKINEEGFSINMEKVRLHDRGSSQRVTGLVVNDKVTLGRKKRKLLRAMVHNIIKNGLETENRENDPFFKERIFGHLAFAKMVEPDFADSMLNSLKSVDWESYDKKLADLKEGELVVRSIKKKNYYVPVIISPSLFSWDEISKNENQRLVEFLKSNYEIDRVDIAQIEKVNDKSIKVSLENNSVLLKLNDEKTRVILEIDNVRTDELIARKEKGKLKIYESSVIKSETDLLKTIFDAITEIKKFIENKRSSQAFWNEKSEITVKGIKYPVLAKPKKEINIQPTLERFFDLQLKSLGIHVSRETNEGVGDLDFKFSFTTETQIRLYVCSELKLAHNREFEGGLTKQLPAYIRANDSKSGIFLVMWFKDEEKKFFSEPINKNKSEMIEFIEDKIKDIKNEDGINIESILIDVSIKPSASNR